MQDRRATLADSTRNAVVIPAGSPRGRADESTVCKEAMKPLEKKGWNVRSTTVAASTASLKACAKEEQRTFFCSFGYKVSTTCYK